jgi:hypothetical protein
MPLMVNQDVFRVDRHQLEVDMRDMGTQREKSRKRITT